MFSILSKKRICWFFLPSIIPDAVPLRKGKSRAIRGHSTVLSDCTTIPADNDRNYAIAPDVDGIITCMGTRKAFAHRLAVSRDLCPIIFVYQPCDLPRFARRSARDQCLQVGDVLEVAVVGNENGAVFEGLGGKP